MMASVSIQRNPAVSFSSKNYQYWAGAMPVQVAISIRQVFLPDFICLQLKLILTYLQGPIQRVGTWEWQTSVLGVSSTWYCEKGIKEKKEELKKKRKGTGEMK